MDEKELKVFDYIGDFRDTLLYIEKNLDKSSHRKLMIEMLDRRTKYLKDSLIKLPE